jgi:hypothetical protein
MNGFSGSYLYDPDGSCGNHRGGASMSVEPHLVFLNSTMLGQMNSLEHMISVLEADGYLVYDWAVDYDRRSALQSASEALTQSALRSAYEQQ